MSYRPLQQFEPITWKGTITPGGRQEAGEEAAKKQTKKQAQP